MACSPGAILDIGGFDERIVPAAEDLDLCYRWLAHGNELRHVPDLVVWHRDWRTPEELRGHYIGYYQGNGRFYAKQLRSGDVGVLRFAAGDCYQWLRSLFAGVARRIPRWADARRGVVPGLPQGLWAGWWEFRGERRRSETDR
jgi:GT2 family glycosyltransferase